VSLRRANITGRDALTPSELRVAQMAAAAALRLAPS